MEKSPPSKKMIALIAVAVVAIVAGAVVGVSMFNNSPYSGPEYTISYNANGGSVDNAIDGYSSITETFSLPVPTKDDCTFLGWYDNSDLAGTPVTQVTKGSSGNISVWAKWQLEKSSLPSAAEMSANTNINVTFSSNDSGEKLLSEDAITALVAGKTLVVKSVDSNKNTVFSLTFDGSKVNSEFSGGTVNTAVSIDTTKANVYREVILNFEHDGELPCQTTVKYYVGGVFSPGTVLDFTNDEDGVSSGKCVVDENGFVEFDIDHCSNWILTQWVKLSFNANGGTFGDGVETSVDANGLSVYIAGKKYKDDTPMETPVPVPTWTGYTFSYWKDNAGIVYDDNEWYVSDTEFKARWAAISYRVSFVTGINTTLDDITYNIEKDTITLPKLSNAGYAFAGWYDNEDFEGNRIDAISKGTYGDKTLYAKWVPMTFKLGFELNGGTMPESDIHLTYGLKYPALPTPIRLGYTFCGWCIDSALTKEITDDTVVASEKDQTVFAKWELTEYAITYNLGYDRAEAFNGKATYTIEDTVSFVSITRPGFNFLGWYSSDDFDDPETVCLMTIEAGSTGDVSVYAKWDPIYLTVNISLDGQPYEGRDVKIVTDDTFVSETDSDGKYRVNITTPLPFYCNVYVDGQLALEARKVTKLSSPISITYYTVSFNTDGGSKVDDMIVLERSKISEPATVKDEASPICWSFTDTGGNDRIWDFDVDTVSGSVTLTAKWSVTVNVTFDCTANGSYGPDGTKMGTVTANYGEELPDLPEVPTRFGYTFGGFYIYDVQYYDADGKGLRLWDKLTDTELKAKWTSVQCKVTVIKESGVDYGDDIGTGWAETAYSYYKNFAYGTPIDDVIADFGSTPSKINYAFDGWSCSVTNVENDSSNDSPNKIYAVFKDKPYRLIFNTDGGSEIEDMFFDGVCQIKMPESVRDHYTLGSWSFYGLSYSPGATVELTEHMLGHADDKVLTFEAKWIADVYTIHFDRNGSGSEAISDLTVSYGTVAELPMIPYRMNDKVARYWNTESDGSGLVLFRQIDINDDFISLTTDSEMTVYPMWVKSEYTATVGDVFSGTYTVDIGGVVQNYNCRYVVIDATLAEYTVECLLYIGGEWIPQYMIGCTNGAYPAYYSADVESKLSKLYANPKSSAGYVVFDNEGTSVQLLLNCHRLNDNGTEYSIGEIKDSTLVYSYSLESADLSISYTLKSIRVGCDFSGSTVTYMKNIDSTSDDEIKAVSSEFYMTPYEIGMADFIGDKGKAFVKWVYVGDDGEVCEYDAGTLVTSPRTVYGVWADTGINWVFLTDIPEKVIITDETGLKNGTSVTSDESVVIKIDGGIWTEDTRTGTMTFIGMTDNSGIYYSYCTLVLEPSSNIQYGLNSDGNIVITFDEDCDSYKISLRFEMQSRLMMVTFM